jgi:hypothetical protein
MTRGYLILELALPDEVQPIIPRILADTKEALSDAAIGHVTRVHAAIGEDGLRESVDYLTTHTHTPTTTEPEGGER